MIDVCIRCGAAIENEDPAYDEESYDAEMYCLELSAEGIRFQLEDQVCATCAIYYNRLAQRGNQKRRRREEEERATNMSQDKKHTPIVADEALYAGMLTTQAVGAIQQAHVDGKIADLETYNHLYAEAKKADAQVQKLARLLEQEKEEQKEYEAWKLQRDVKAATEVFKGMVNWQEEEQKQ